MYCDYLRGNFWWKILFDALRFRIASGLLYPLKLQFRFNGCFYFIIFSLSLPRFSRNELSVSTRYHCLCFPESTDQSYIHLRIYLCHFQVFNLPFSQRCWIGVLLSRITHFRDFLLYLHIRLVPFFDICLRLFGWIFNSFK